MTRDTYDAGYDACYDGKPRAANPCGNDDWDGWQAGWDAAAREIRDDMELESGQEEFDSGRWMPEDTDSMEHGRDLPCRNDAAEYY